MPKKQNAWRPGNTVWIWGVLPAVFAIAILWYPFGLSLGGMLEEYDILGLINLNPGFWNSFPGHILSQLFAARPFQVLPHAIAHQLSPHSFTGFHVLLMVACLLRVVGGASIGYFLFRNRLFAAAMGLLFLVFPGDTQQFHFRTMHICLAVGLAIFGAACSLRALLDKHPSRRWALVATGAVLSCVGVLIYEPVFTLYALMPVVLAARCGVPRAVRVIWRKRGIAAIWALGPIANIAYLFYAIVIFKSSYQVNASQGSMSKSIVHNLHYLLDSAAYRVFFDAWISAFHILTQRTVHFGYLAAVFVVFLLMFVYFAGGRHSPIRCSRFLRYVLAGLLLSIAGYLPFMVAETHMVITQRTFIAVAPGASLIVVALIQAISRRANMVAAVLAACVVTLGTVAQLYQFDLYTRAYTSVVRPYLSQVADRSDPSRHVHLVQDSSGFAGYLNGIYFSKIVYGPGVRRGVSTDTYILCEDSAQTSMTSFSRCSLSNGTWRVTDGKGGERSFPANQVDVIEMGKHFDASYRSPGHSWRDPGNYDASQSMFTSMPGASRDAYACVADSAWGYSDYCRGMGWSDGIFSHATFIHKTFFAATATRASLIFNLEPARAPYQLLIDMFSDNGSSPTDLTLQLNGSPFDFKVFQGRFLVATVSPALLKDGQNELVFNGALAPGRVLGMSVSSVALAPSGSKLLSAYGLDLSPAKITANQWIGAGSTEAVKMLASGFSGAEPEGRWTDGKKAVIEFALPSGTNARTFVAEVMPFLDDRHTHVDVDVTVNGEPALHKAFASPAQREVLEIPLGRVGNNAGGLVHMTLAIKDPAKPQSADTRDLGVFLYRFKVK